MSDNIPFEIQIEIIKRVSDVKSLIRLRCVSKPWMSLIDSYEFISGYRARKTHTHTLLLRYRDTSDEIKYVSVNNATFTQQQDLAPNVSALMKQLRNLLVIGYSRGLLCLYTFDNGGMLVLWNPSLRRSVGIFGGYFRVFGFAVCPVTNDPTIVRISCAAKVEIFTLSSKRWTEIQCSMPRKSKIFHEGSQAVIGSCIYRVAYETICLPDGSFTDQYMIVSFDLIAKELKAIDLPDKITDPFPIRVPFFLSYIVGFMKNGEVLVETKEWCGRLGLYNRECALEVYDPCSKQITNLGLSRQKGTFFVSSYKETLLLLDHSDSCEYPGIN
nr:hypothetical protein [Tanacetum cinerariifolium]